MNLYDLIRNGSTVTIVRHGKTTKPEPKEGLTPAEIDGARTLTPEGHMLAQKAGEALDKSSLAAVFYSNATRCRQTAESMLGEIFETTPMIPVDAAYPFSPECKGAADINVAFETLRDAPLANYDEAGCSAALDEYADGVINTIYQDVVDGDFLIVAHAVCSPAIARRIGKELGLDLTEVNQFRSAECSMIVVTKDGITCVPAPVLAVPAVVAV